MEIALNISTVRGFLVGVLAMFLYNIFGSSIQHTHNEEMQDSQQESKSLVCSEPQQRTCPVCSSSYDPNAKVKMTDLIKRNYNVDEYHNPRIMEIPNLFTEEECDTIIRDVMSHPLEAAVVVNPSRDNEAKEENKETVEKIQSRRSRTRGLDRNHGNFSDVYNRIAQTIAQQNEVFWKERIPLNFNSDLFENIQFGRYDARDKGHYNWHSDVGVKGSLAKRRLSAVVMLSDSSSFTGGVFQIQTTAKTTDLHTQRGSLIVFPSYVLHRVTEVLTGTRYSLACWIQTE